MGVQNFNLGITFMSDQQQAIDSLKVLVAVAMADGLLQLEEQEELREALQAVNLTDITVESLLEEKEPLTTILARITTPELQAEVYSAAYAMANASGGCSVEEQVILDKIKATYSINPENDTLVNSSVTVLQKDVTDDGDLVKIDDPATREEAVQELIKKYAITTAVLGLNPFLGLSVITNLAALGLNLVLMNKIGALYGFPKGQDTKQILTNLLGGLGALTASIGVGVIVSAIPILNVFTMAPTNFVFTYAIGQATNQYYANSRQINVEDMKKIFQDAKVKAKDLYNDMKEEIQAKQKSAEVTLKSLNDNLRKGKITREEYQDKIKDVV